MKKEEEKQRRGKPNPDVTTNENKIEEPQGGKLIINLFRFMEFYKEGKIEET